MFDENNISIYSSRDRIREQLLVFARDYIELGAGFDFSKTSYLSYLVNILSILTSNLIYYNTSIYREFFLTRAIQKESVLNLATMLGYNPPLATPALASVLMEIPMSFTRSDSSAIVLTFNGLSDDILASEKPYQFYATDDVVFTTLNTVTVEIYPTYNTATVYETLPSGGKRVIPSNIKDGNLKFLISAIQVEQISPTSSASGSVDFTIPNLKPYEFYTKDITFEKDGYLAGMSLVTVSPDYAFGSNLTSLNRWTGPTDSYGVNSLFLIPKNGRYYIFRHMNTTSGNGIKLYFGNGIIGRQPTSGWKCKVSYNLTKGSDGNVIAGSITSADRYLVKDIKDNKEITRYLQFRVINPSPAFGGTDELTLDQIRANAISRVSANKRLVSVTDFNNAKNILDTLPVNNSIHVLKRSDIKANEIALFSDLLYADPDSPTTVVPTRNETVIVDTTSTCSMDILTGDVFDVDGENYVSMFNLNFDIESEVATYKYLLDVITSSLTTIQTYNVESDINPESATFSLDKTDSCSPQINIYYNYYPTRNVYNPGSHEEIDIDLLNLVDLMDYRCMLSTSWSVSIYGDQEIPMTHMYSYSQTEPIFKFKYIMDLSDIPEDKQTYIFKLYKVVGTPQETMNGVTVSDNDHWVQNPTTYLYENLIPITDSQISITVHSDLAEFMTSQIVSTGDEGNEIVTAYNVPLVKKEYYDVIDKNNFETAVYQKLVDFDVSKYKMLTDFVNLKFSNTTGYLRNMLLNKINRDPVIGINPENIPTSPTHGDRYAVSEDPDVNPWGKNRGFIAQWDSTAGIQGEWVFERLIVNDIFNQVLDQSLGDTTSNVIQRLIYNGNVFVEPVQSIPIQLKAIIWMDRTQPYTENTVVSNVKSALVNNLYFKFGYDANIYVSDITRTIQNVPGVDHCKVLSPEHDIFFNYDIKQDFTEHQLLEYTPELVFFDTSSISIEVR